MLKYSKNIDFRKIILGKKVSCNSIEVGKISDVKVKNDSIIIKANIKKEYQDIIAKKLSADSCTTIIADLGIELVNTLKNGENENEQSRN